MVPASQHRNVDRRPERCTIALDHVLDRPRQLVARDEDRHLSSDTRARDVVSVHLEDARLRALLALIAGRPLHSLSCFAESRRTPHEQVPAGRLPLFIAAPEEEPLNDLAQPLLGLLRREEGGAGRWL
jgi:hypothetical protein